MDNFLGKRIKQARKTAGLTQVKLAELLSIAESTLNKYEKGHRTPDSALLGQMARILKCDPSWLLTGESIIPQVNEFPLPYLPESAVKSEHASEDQYIISTEETTRYAKIVTEILQSRTGYALALRENIRWFNEAVKAQKEKEKAKTEEDKNRQEIEELKARVKSLEEGHPRPVKSEDNN